MGPPKLLHLMHSKSCRYDSADIISRKMEECYLNVIYAPQKFIHELVLNTLTSLSHCVSTPLVLLSLAVIHESSEVYRSVALRRA